MVVSVGGKAREQTRAGERPETNEIQNWNRLSYERTVLYMTLDEAREEIISGIDYAASRED